VSPTGTSDTPNTDDDGERRDTPNIDLPDIQCITGYVALTPGLHAFFRDISLSDNVSPAGDVERAQRRGRRALVKLLRLVVLRRRSRPLFHPEDDEE